MTRARDLANSADLSFDGSTFKIDTANDRVGIGTATPQSFLHVETSGSDFLRLTSATGNNDTGIDFFKTTTRMWNIRNNGNNDYLYITPASINDSDAVLAINPNGNVGIGNTSPEYPLQVSGSNVSSGGGLATLGIYDTGTAYDGTNPGGGITFRGKYNNAGSLTNFATVQGVKENATDGDYASALRFTTRENGGNLIEHMNISSSGVVTATGFSGKIHPVSGTTTNYLSLKDSNELNFFNSSDAPQTLHINYDTVNNAGGNLDLSGSAVSVVHSANNSEPTVTVKGRGYGYTHGAIALKSSTGDDARVRGQGIFLFNEENDTTWYVGTPYLNTSAGSRPFDFNFKSSTTSLSAVTAHTDNTKARIHASGVISAPSGIELGSGLDATAANTLDYYEEGNWTPSLGGNTIYNSQNGEYTRVGNMVTIWCNIYVNTLGTGSQTTISGLPFSVSNITEFNVNGSHVSYYTSAANNASGYTATVEKNGTTIVMRRIPNGGATSMNSWNFFANSTDVYFTITYRTG
tara:strand:+ start:4589 stop:6151 length:1563 start_codon:yes stop_codon:yes gene_type:complete